MTGMRLWAHPFFHVKLPVPPQTLVDIMNQSVFLPPRRAVLALALALLPAAAFAQTEGDLFGSWKYTCAEGACRAFLNVKQGEQIVVSWTLLRDRERDQSTSVIRVPQGVALPPGLRIYADDTTFFDMPFQVCDPEGCAAVAVMDSKMQAAIAGKNVVRVAFIRYGESGTVAYEVPVDGFSAALDAL